MSNLDIAKDEYMRKKEERIRLILEDIFDRVYSSGMGGAFSMSNDYDKALGYSLGAKDFLIAHYDNLFKVVSDNLSLFKTNESFEDISNILDSFYYKWTDTFMRAYTHPKRISGKFDPSDLTHAANFANQSAVFLVELESALSKDFVPPGVVEDTAGLSQLGL